MSPPCWNSTTTWVCWGSVCRLVPRRNCPDIPKWTTRTSPSSRYSSRYFPLRSTLAIFFPASRSENSLRRACRRMTRIAFRWGRTSTSLIRLPTTSFSRSRRITSTSGSSTVPSGSVAVSVLLRQLRVLGQPVERLSGRPLLRFLLRSPDPPAELSPGQEDRRRELLLVVRPPLDHAVLREPPHVLGGQLLEDGLVIPLALSPDVGGDPRPEQPLDQRGGLLEAQVDVDRAQHRLQGVGQDAGLVPAPRLLLALAQEDGIAQSELASHLRQHGHVHHGRSQLGQLALRAVGEGPVDQVRHNQPEHRVTQELQPLVGDGQAVFEGERPMGERPVPEVGGLE